MEMRTSLLKLLFKNSSLSSQKLKQSEERLFWLSIFFLSAISVIGFASKEAFSGIITKVVLSSGILLLGWSIIYYMKVIALRKKEENERLNNIILMICEEDKEFFRSLNYHLSSDLWMDDFFLFVLKMAIVFVIASIFLF